MERVFPIEKVALESVRGGEHLASFTGAASSNEQSVCQCSC